MSNRCNDISEKESKKPDNKEKICTKKVFIFAALCIIVGLLVSSVVAYFCLRTQLDNQYVILIAYIVFSLETFAMALLIGVGLVKICKNCCKKEPTDFTEKLVDAYLNKQCKSDNEAKDEKKSSEDQAK